METVTQLSCSPMVHMLLLLLVHAGPCGACSQNFLWALSCNNGYTFSKPLATPCTARINALAIPCKQSSCTYYVWIVHPFGAYASFVFNSRRAFRRMQSESPLGIRPPCPENPLRCWSVDPQYTSAEHCTTKARKPYTCCFLLLLFSFSAEPSGVCS